MEPIFVYFDKIKFDETDTALKTFTLSFSDGDALDGVLFKKTNDYYITSMICSITIEKDFTELKDYDNMKKISDIANDYLKNGINHFKKSPKLSTSIFYKNYTFELAQDQTKQLLSTVTIPFIDLETKKRNEVKIYSPYENLKIHGLKFSSRYLIYNLNLITENGQLLIEKKVQLRRSRSLLTRNAILKTYSDNLVLIKYNNKFEALYFPIAKYHFNRKNEISKQQFDRERLTHNFVYNSFFTDLTAYPSYIVTVNESSLSNRYPIFWGQNYIKIHPNTEIYFTESLYEKLKTKMTFGPSITLTDLESFNLRHKYSWFGENRKFYTFVNKNPNATWTFSADDFNLLDEDIKITTAVKDIENVFNFNSDFNSNSRIVTLKVKSPEDLDQKMQSDELNFLQSNKINANSLTYAHENFFLYDLENMIRPTFTTELQQEFSIYGLIYFSGEQKDKLDLVKPKNKLKFQLDRDIYKKQIKFEIAKVHKKKTFDIVSDYVSNFSILRTEKSGIGNKRKMKNEIIDEIPILGIQNSEFNVLNPIYVSINSNDIISRLQLYRNNRFKFVLNSLLFSSNITNETDVIIITSNGLSETKQALIIKNNKPTLESTLGVCFLNEIPEWKVVKGASKRVQVVFSDSENLNQNSNHFGFSFITRNITDLLQFSITLLDGAGEKITFPASETKLPIINFSIQILK